MCMLNIKGIGSCMEPPHINEVMCMLCTVEALATTQIN